MLKKIKKMIMIGSKFNLIMMVLSKIFINRWTGKCWHIYDHVKYEFDLQFEVN